MPPRGRTCWGWPSFSAGAFAAMLGGLQLVGAVRNAIIGVMEPLGVAVLAAFFLDEPITAPTAIGGVLILGGAILATLVRTTTGPRAGRLVASEFDDRPALRRGRVSGQLRGHRRRHPRRRRDPRPDRLLRARWRPARRHRDPPMGRRARSGHRHREDGRRHRPSGRGRRAARRPLRHRRDRLGAPASDDAHAHRAACPLRRDLPRVRREGHRREHGRHRLGPDGLRARRDEPGDRQGDRGRSSTRSSTRTGPCT